MKLHSRQAKRIAPSALLLPLLLISAPSAWAQPSQLPPPPPPPTMAPANNQQPWAYPLPMLPPYMLIPPTLPYSEDQEIPPGYRLETRTNKPFLITGVSLFGLAYGLSLGASLIILGGGGSRSGEIAPLLVPLIGPFIMTGSADEGNTTFLLDGITQAIGVTLMSIAIFKKDQLLVRNDIKLSKAAPEVFVGPKAASLRWTF